MIEFELPYQDPCFFCEIIRRQSVEDFVYETDESVVRVNGRQFLEGQCVALPKRHAPTLFDLTEDEASDIVEVARVVGKALSVTVGAEGLLIYQNNGVASLQEVPHFHLHIVPQWKTETAMGKLPPHITQLEGQQFQPVKPTYLSDDQIRDMTSRIRANLPL